MLVLSSKDLQREIVDSGRVSEPSGNQKNMSIKNDQSVMSQKFTLCSQGAASMKEFYAKNSRWTEGLISASKAVGWGATMLV